MKNREDGRWCTSVTTSMLAQDTSRHVVRMIEFPIIVITRGRQMLNKILAPAICVTILLFGSLGCAPTIAKVGDFVRVDYIGEFLDGTKFDSSESRGPLQFQLGQGQVVPGFENAVLGMQVGEKKTVEIPSEDAYGAYHEDLLFELPASDFGPDAEFALGGSVVLRGADATLTGIITDFTDTIVTVDANHPLAGKTLVFHLELIEIVEPA